MNKQQALGKALIEQLPAEQKNAIIEAALITLLSNHPMPWGLGRDEFCVIDKKGEIVLHTTDEAATGHVLEFAAKYYEATHNIEEVAEEEEDVTAIVES